MNIQKSQDGSIYIDIDQSEGYRLPTQEEYYIMRALLGIPAVRPSTTTLFIPNATIQGMDGGSFTMTATTGANTMFGDVTDKAWHEEQAQEALREMYPDPAGKPDPADGSLRP